MRGEAERQVLNLIAVLSILVFGLGGAPLYGSSAISKGWERPHGVNEIIGTWVINHQGKYLGRVQDFVFDPNGRVIFAIIGPRRWNWKRIGENSVAIPFNTLTYDRSGKRPVVVADISWERFQDAPRFAKIELTDRQQVEEIYKYFGQRPYWTERRSAGKMGHRTEKPLEGQMAK